MKEGPKIHEWLTAVENEMRRTLATLLEKSVLELNEVASDNDKFLQWIDKYPAQLILIAAQINWSEKV